MTDEATQMAALADELERCPPNALGSRRYVFAFSESQRGLLIAALHALSQGPVAWRWKDTSDNWLYIETEPTLLTAGRLNEVEPLYAEPIQSSPSGDSKWGVAGSSPADRADRPMILPQMAEAHIAEVAGSNPAGARPVAQSGSAPPRPSINAALPLGGIAVDGHQSSDGPSEPIAQGQREAIADLPMYWTGRAKTLTLIRDARDASAEDYTLGQIGAFEDCAKELRAILATLPQPPVGACREALVNIKTIATNRCIGGIGDHYAATDEECCDEIAKIARAALAPSAQDGERAEKREFIGVMNALLLVENGCNDEAAKRFADTFAEKCSENAKLIVRVAELEKALEPFAKFAGRFGPKARDDSWQLTNNPSGKGNLTMGDVRHARSVVTRPQCQGGET